MGDIMKSRKSSLGGLEDDSSWIDFKAGDDIFTAVFDYQSLEGDDTGNTFQWLGTLLKAKIESELEDAMLFADLTLIKRCSKLVDCLEWRNSKGKGLIHVASELGHNEIVEWLLTLGENKFFDDDGNNALHCAVRANKLEIIPLLVMADISYKQVNGEGKSACDLATGKSAIILQDAIEQCKNRRNVKRFEGSPSFNNLSHDSRWQNVIKRYQGNEIGRLKQQVEELENTTKQILFALNGEHRRNQANHKVLEKRVADACEVHAENFERRVGKIEPSTVLVERDKESLKGLQLAKMSNPDEQLEARLVQSP